MYSVYHRVAFCFIFSMFRLGIFILFNYSSQAHSCFVFADWVFCKINDHPPKTPFFDDAMMKKGC